MQANGIAQVVLFSCLLLTASLWDIRKRIIPDTICVLIALAGLLMFEPKNLMGALLGLPLLIAALLSEGGMGGGDVKLVAACGFARGLPEGCVGLFLGLSAALVWSGLANGILRAKRIPIKSAKAFALPMAPFLSLGFIAAFIL